MHMRVIVRRGLWLVVAGVLWGSVGCGGGGASGGGNSGGLPDPDPGNSIIVDHQEAMAATNLLPAAWLAQARTKALVFGHQSVGWNIIDGLSDLASSDPGRFAIEVVEPPTSLPDGGMAEFAVGDNGDPLGKFADFDTKVRAWIAGGAAYQVYMMKLCYVDIDSGTDVTALFDDYRDRMAGLASAFPTRTFVYTTVPLMTDYNAERAQYNQLVRDYCAANNKVLFDIAAIESHDPSGSAVGGGQPRMYGAYSSDGGHLNGTGAARMARAYWWLLARVAGWDGR